MDHNLLSHIHDNQIWLENGTIWITKMIVHRVLGYPTLDKSNRMQSDANEVIEKNMGVAWNK